MTAKQLDKVHVPLNKQVSRDNMFKKLPLLSYKLYKFVTKHTNIIFVLSFTKIQHRFNKKLPSYILLNEETCSLSLIKFDLLVSFSRLE